MLQKSVLFLFIIFYSFAGFSQVSDTWEVVQESTISVNEDDRRIIPLKYSTLELNRTELATSLAACDRWNPNENQPGRTIMIPNPIGELVPFKVVYAPIMHDDLAKKYPEIKTYKGWSIENPSITVRLDLTQVGFHAMVYDGADTWYIDPYALGNDQYYMAYFKKDFISDKTFSCTVEDNQIDLDTPDEVVWGDCQLRTYRLALACTGEYAQYHGGTTSLVLAAMVTSMNRVNGVYEREAGLTMVLIANNDQIIYLNAASDPYTNDDGGAMLSENQTTIDNIIGPANYDIGHVFSTGGGGIASLNSPCSSFKARGVTGQPNPIGDPFDIDYVAHEMGHQYGANHTQNNSCNRNDDTAMEPGSASTIMGYAGICFPNVQNNSDDYFHAASLEEIYDNIMVGNSSTCPTTTNLGNAQPTVDAGGNYIIPKSTYFVLEAIGNDADNGDVPTYCWEQMDNDVANMPPESTSSLGPAFRSYDPTVDPKRYFPKLSDIIANTSTDWEVLPSVERTMNFRVTIRDNHPQGGCVGEDDMVVSVAGNSGPFVVNQPNTQVDWPALSDQTVTWDVANTTAAPVSASTVDIFLSTDGGLTYPISLAQNVPNDGAHQVTMPDVMTTTARIMVRGHQNIFFDISNANFVISEAQVGFNLNLSIDSLELCSPTTTTITVNVESISGFSGNVQLSANNVPSGMSVQFSPTSVNAPGTATMSITTTGGLSDGWYDVGIHGQSGSLTKDKSIQIFSASGTPGAFQLMSPANASTGTSLSTLFDWTDSNNSQYYTFELFDDANLTSLIHQAEHIPSSQYQLPISLDPSSTYHWQVKGHNPCGIVVSDLIFSFTTASIFCKQYQPNDLPISIPSNSTSTIQSVINVPDEGTLTSIKINNLNITHSWINDLVVRLKAPDNTQVTLINQICNGQDNIWVNFDDHATNSYSSLPCPPDQGETYEPFQNMETAFVDKEVNGNWTLEVEDNYSQDGGEFNAWELDVCFLVSDMSATVNTTDVLCAGGSTGTAEVVVVGGTPDYTYQWSSGNPNQLPAGNYSVTVTDAVGESVIVPFTIVEPNAMVLSGVVTNATTGQNNGAIDLSFQGGTPPYYFEWSNFMNTEDIFGLAPDTYCVTVTDVNDCAVDTCFLVQESCGMPTNVSWTYNSPTSVTITWDVVSGADNYEIQYREDGSSTWMTMTTSANQIQLTGLSSGNTYDIRIRSQCNQSWSNYYNDNLMMPDECLAPTNISTQTVTSNSATIQWDEMSGAQEYIVSYRKIGTTNWTQQTTTTNSISLSGLESSSSYEFMVSTDCGSFSSNESEVLVFTTMQACLPPQGLAVNSMDNITVDLSWQAMTGVSEYAVRYSVLGASSWSSMNTTGTSLTITDLMPGATYEFQIQSKCGFAWSPFSDIVLVNMPFNCQIVSLSIIETTENSISLSWSDILGATEYMVYYKASGSSDFDSVLVDVSQAQIQNLEPNTSYLIYVSANCQSDWGADSDIITANTKPVHTIEIDSQHAITYFPNPVTDFLYVEYTIQPNSIRVIDILGRLWEVESFDDFHRIDLSKLTNGHYFLEFEFENGVRKTIPIVKKNL